MIRLDLEYDASVQGSLPEGTRDSFLRSARAAALQEGIRMPACVHVRVTDDPGIREINRVQRKLDRATDVLSFPTVRYPAGKTAGQTPNLLSREYDPDEDAAFLGDILISLPRARAQAAEYGHSLERELNYLLVHGLFHLFGYDHMTESDKRSMRAMEEKTLDSVGMGRITDEELIALAKEAMTHAYAPYSHFRVGACLLTREGRVYQGCNIENSSYGATNCAERTALFKAVYEGERDFVKLAIASEKALAWPCGICRQALFEFAPELEIIVSCGEERDRATLSDLLPHGFGPANGTKDYLGSDCSVED